jgi:HemK-related putative methylase
MPYPPSEDSYLLENELKNYLTTLSKKEKYKIKVLDMGSGSGIQAKACISEGIKKSNILCADIDKEAINYLKKQKLKAIHTNLFQKINKKLKFDLIAFNTPYLPEDKYDKEADTTGGKEGYEITVKFLKEAKTYLKKEGIMIILFSSLSKPKIILKQAKILKYTTKKLAEKDVGFFEKLLVYKLKKH